MFHEKKEEVGPIKIESQSLLLQIARDVIICHLEDRIPKVARFGRSATTKVGRICDLA